MDKLLQLSDNNNFAYYYCTVKFLIKPKQIYILFTNVKKRLTKMYFRIKNLIKCIPNLTICYDCYCFFFLSRRKICNFLT